MTVTDPALDVDVARLLDRSATSGWPELPAATRGSATALVLDALALAAAAPAAPSLRATARAHARLSGGDAAGAVALPFVAAHPGPSAAAAALSVAVHAWDFDDTHDDAVVHTACVALPAALATALECGADGRRVLEGLVSGVEVLCRLSSAVGARPGVVRTAGLGAFGAAAAASRVLGLDAARTGQALALALPAALAPTSRQVVSDSAVNKRHQPALAVHAGVTAAYLAAEGVDGPPGWVDGEHGLVRHVSDPGARDRLATPGWEVDRVSLKPYPACRYAHAAVAGTLELTGAVPDPEAVVQVHLPVGSHHALVARPFERRGLPVVDAQFSVPWLVAAALVHGRVGLSEMSEVALLDPVVERVARTQVTVVQDQQPGSRVMVPVEVRLTGAAGEVRTRVEALPGSPELPLDRAAHRAKVADCLAVGGRPADDVELLVRLVDDLPVLDPTSLRRRLAELRPAPTGHDPSEEQR